MKSSRVDVRFARGRIFQLPPHVPIIGTATRNNNRQTDRLTDRMVVFDVSVTLQNMEERSERERRCLYHLHLFSFWLFPHADTRLHICKPERKKKASKREGEK